MNDSPRPVLRIALLAAGYSRRLQSPKALARVRGLSLLRRSAAVLAPFTAARLIVVLPPHAARYRAELRGIDAEILANRRRALGLSTSVRAALVRARCASAILFVPVDLAALQARDVARLIALWRGHRRAIVARRIGAHGGTPLILPRAQFAAAARIEGDVGLRDFLRRCAAPERRLLALPSAALDVDTPGDLRRARR
ncbi:MAG TPA: nucleotidyltransferase family protein [Steroidobacteraceae bacterium]|nr:nucleotidyltransferase family protein [Steroidobacteraceae bacterium]